MHDKIIESFNKNCPLFLNTRHDWHCKVIISQYCYFLLQQAIMQCLYIILTSVAKFYKIDMRKCHLYIMIYHACGMSYVMMSYQKIFLSFPTNIVRWQLIQIISSMYSITVEYIILNGTPTLGNDWLIIQPCILRTIILISRCHLHHLLTTLASWHFKLNLVRLFYGNWQDRLIYNLLFLF